MIASRRLEHAEAAAVNTACPPRRSFVASDARRRGQACSTEYDDKIACGDVLPTPALPAGVDNTFPAPVSDRCRTTEIR
jgi:hypothetical protein